MKTIVVGYDGTEAAEAALRRAAELAGAFGATVIVASVDAGLDPLTELPPGAFGLAPYVVVPPVPDDREPWLPHHEEVEALLGERGVAHETVTLLGRPSDELVQLADERNADLLVVGTHEPGFFERLVAGSVSGQVARRAHCDVLIVHAPRGRES